MIIDFPNIEETLIPKFKGGEKETAARMYFDGTTRIMQGRLAPGASIGLHTHTDNCEVIFLTQGHGSILYDGERLPFAAGQAHYCPKGHEHSLINDSDAELRFLAVVPKQ